MVCVHAARPQLPPFFNGPASPWIRRVNMYFVMALPPDGVALNHRRRPVFYFYEPHCRDVAAGEGDNALGQELEELVVAPERSSPSVRTHHTTTALRAYAHPGKTAESLGKDRGP